MSKTKTLILGLLLALILCSCEKEETMQNEEVPEINEHQENISFNIDNQAYQYKPKYMSGSGRSMACAPIDDEENLVRVGFGVNYSDYTPEVQVEDIRFMFYLKTTLEEFTPGKTEFEHDITEIWKYKYKLEEGSLHYKQDTEADYEHDGVVINIKIPQKHNLTSNPEDIPDYAPDYVANQNSSNFTITNKEVLGSAVFIEGTFNTHLFDKNKNEVVNVTDGKFSIIL